MADKEDVVVEVVKAITVVFMAMVCVVVMPPVHTAHPFAEEDMPPITTRAII
ncbi:hypothetical protein PtA15_9A21 [Puccinia triticina]|uniref:Transmembrane protein n=1 Tax=Puccinia triticina TaxID=208348 RepID=A0ABY7CYV4_9BASI|nr:uncharacterized protein PtA15_9A21 [Puccinia triticina]WAQ87897.1 hypothetical protein PtA15_9A21 [Puccinia triticina]